MADSIRRGVQRSMDRCVHLHGGSALRGIDQEDQAPAWPVPEGDFRANLRILGSKFLHMGASVLPSGILEDSPRARHAGGG